MNKQIQFKQKLCMISLLLTGFPLMSHAEACSNAHISNQTTESWTASFNSDYGNVYFHNEGLSNCNSKNGPCLIAPGQTVYIDYTTSGGKTSGIGSLISTINPNLEFELSYSAINGCPEVKVSAPYYSKTNTSGDIDIYSNN